MDVTALCIPATLSIREAIACMDAARRGIVLVVDQDRRLVGTVTDGDVRRAILYRVSLEQPISVVLARKATTPYAKPITASVESDRNTHVALLREHKILHLPLLDPQQRVVDLVTLGDCVSQPTLPLQAVVMAGGRGSRLAPLTDGTPKPMLPVGDRPLLEIIIGQLREAGIRAVTVTTHHQPEKIEAHFGDGRNFGVALSYVEEGRPLGTGGGLGLLEAPKDTMLVMNGDILTQVDFRAMLAYHREHQADLTLGVRHYDFKVPYGVVECDGPVVRRLSEKPVVDFFVNAGIYLLEPAVYQFLPPDQRFDMTELIQRLIDQGRAVVGFPIREYWLDIGEHAEYQRAEQDIRTGKMQL